MNFKQKLALSLCTFYLFSVIGVALSLHFCGGKLASVTVNSSKNNCKVCANESFNKKDDGCCKNTKVELKVKDDHQNVAAKQIAKLFSNAVALPVHLLESCQKFKSTIILKVVNKPPPLITSIAIHVFNCVFRN